MKKILVGVAVALSLVTSHAAADGIDRRPPPSMAGPAPIYAPTWSGFYIGAGIGGAAVVHDHSLRDVDFGDSNFDGIGRVGVFGTAIVGWDWQVGRNTVFGIFADYDFSNNNNAEFSLFDGLITGSLDHDHTWSAGARLGVLSSPSTLWYATGGYTEARFESSINFNFDDVGVGVSRERTFQGWFVGGGVDTRLAASNWFLRLEYRFSQFDDERVLRDDFTTIDLEPTVHTTRLTLTYKFTPGLGWGGWGAGANTWGR
jgi:outer membrane immunogenic protein